jgi:PKD repeat protein
VRLREDMVASLPGETSEYVIDLLSQRGYTGTVTLSVTGLGAEAASVVLDPVTVEVPGSSRLTIEWDPLLWPPTGGSEYPFEVVATEVGKAATETRSGGGMGIVIDPGDRHVTQYVHPADPIAGGEAEVWGRVTPHASSETVWINVGGAGAELYAATTGGEGRYSVRVPVQHAKPMTFAAEYGGAVSPEYGAVPHRGRRYIHLTAHTADGTFDPGDLVQLDGEIAPNPGAGELYLEIRGPEGTYAYKGPVTVDSGGSFHQTFYAQQGVTSIMTSLVPDEDYYNAQARLTVPVNVPIGMAVIGAGGGNNPANTLWEATEALTDRAWQVYRGRLIPAERIRYLHPDSAHDADGNGTPDVSAAPTKANLQNAITTWAAGLVDVSSTYAPYKTPLTLYLMGLEASPGVFRLNGTETVTAAELSSWLNAFETNAKARFADPNDAPEHVPASVVLEFARSGQFADDLASPQRIIVTSTGDGSGDFPGTNLVSPDGSIAFSRFFHDEIDQGKYVATGWATAAGQVLPLTGYSQQPLLDANGNGIPNEEIDVLNGDGAGDKVLEYRDTAGRRPRIASMFHGLNLAPGEFTGTLWARIEADGEAIVAVQCLIKPPAGSGERDRVYPMAETQPGLWTLAHDGFHSKGTYFVLVTALDAEGDAALPWPSYVDVASDTPSDDTTPPANPTNLVARGEDRQAHLTWDRSPSSDLAGYLLYTKTAGGSYGTPQVLSGLAQQITVTGLVNGLSYVFKLTAVDEVPNESSGAVTGPVMPRGAQFSASVTKGLPPLEVCFTDQSTGGPYARLWDTDGDGEFDATGVNPCVTYSAVGTYDVWLRSYYADGYEDDEIKAGYVQAKLQLADFEADQTHGTLPLLVRFTDESVSEHPVTAWAWDLDGDGQFDDSTAASPTHLYESRGAFDVGLRITTADGTDATVKESYIVTACPQPAPTFDAAPRSGPPPLETYLISTTPTDYAGCEPQTCDWMVGDGGIAACAPETDCCVSRHTYAEGGIYEVCLTVQVPGTSGMACKSDYVVTAPEIELVSPVGGESWPAGTDQVIEYHLRGNPSAWVTEVSLEAALESGTSPVSELGSVPTGGSGDGTYETVWSIPAMDAENVRIRASAKDNADGVVATDESGDVAITLVKDLAIACDGETGETELSWSGGPADLFLLDGSFNPAFTGATKVVDVESPYVDPSPVAARHYRVANPGTTAVHGVTVGRRQVPVRSGYNLLAVPLVNEPCPLASEIASAIDLSGGSVMSISRWDSSSQTWRVYDPFFPIDDFELEPGQGFFLQAAADSTWPVCGEVVRNRTVDFGLATGYAMPAAPTWQYATASDLVGAMITAGLDIDELSKWNSASGTWSVYDPTFPVEDFAIEPADGYFARAAADAVFVLDPMSLNVERLSETEATIEFATDLPGVAWIEWGTDPDFLDETAYDVRDPLYEGTDHDVLVTGLAAGKDLHFRILFLGTVMDGQ